MLPCVCSMGFMGRYCQLKKQEIRLACSTVNCGNGICVNDVRIYLLYSID